MRFHEGGRCVIGALKHLKRLEVGCTALGLEYPGEWIERSLLSSLRREAKNFEGDFRVRLRVGRNGKPTLDCEPFVPRLPIEGAALLSFVAERSKPDVKIFIDPVSIAATENALRNGYDEALLVSGEGFIREGAWSNVYWKIKEGMFSNNRNALSGITQSLIGEFLETRGGLSFLESPLVNVARNADKMFLSNATHGVVPVVRLDDRRFEIEESDLLLNKEFIDWALLHSTNLVF